MYANDSDANQERGDQERSNAGQEHDEDGQHHQRAKCLTIGERTAEDHERLIRRSEEVKEDPSGKEAEEDEEREGMR